MHRRMLDTPARYETPQRPGQPGHEQKRPGPSPASAHPTGPAPPFEPAVSQGASESEPDRRRERDRRWPTD